MLCIQSARLSLPSSELAPPRRPFTPQRVLPPPRFRGSRFGRRDRPQSTYKYRVPYCTYKYRAPQCMSPHRNWDSPTPSPDDQRKSLALCLLCGTKQTLWYSIMQYNPSTIVTHDQQRGDSFSQKYGFLPLKMSLLFCHTVFIARYQPFALTNFVISKLVRLPSRLEKTKDSFSTHFNFFGDLPCHLRKHRCIQFQQKIATVCFEN